MRLFLCDDNAEYRLLARYVLERAGYEIVGEAADGQEAIERAPEVDPEVLLLDLNMPRVSGWEALPTLRSLLPHTKLVVLTTGRALDERHRVLDAGADGFIVKPPRITALEDELAASLRAA
jgi:two-component system chemotaxis response regulator CheY